MVDIGRIRNTEGVWEVTWQFEDTSFESLKDIAEELSFKAGATVFKEGDAADGMYLVLEGSVLIIRKSKSGEERTVAIITEGQSFGELGLLVERPRQATAAAGTDMRCLKITNAGLDLLHQHAPDMAYKMYKVLARTLAEQLLQTQDMQRPD